MTRATAAMFLSLNENDNPEEKKQRIIDSIPEENQIDFLYDVNQIIVERLNEQDDRITTLENLAKEVLRRYPNFFKQSPHYENYDKGVV